MEEPPIRKGILFIVGLIDIIAMCQVTCGAESAYIEIVELDSLKGGPIGLVQNL